MDGERAYELAAYCKALGRSIKLVTFVLVDGSCRMFFQIEFCYRDGHQFTGLGDCKARDENRIDFAVNASFGTVNVAKVMRGSSEPTSR